jgi:AraC-like DNA-binding protein
MASRLDNITDWETLARQCHYSTTELARRCAVSSRHLRRHFSASFHSPLATWLRQLRLRDAASLLQQGNRVKEVACVLGYKQRPHFSAIFHKYFGTSPSQFAAKQNLDARSLKCPVFVPNSR